MTLTSPVPLTVLHPLAAPPRTGLADEILDWWEADFNLKGGYVRRAHQEGGSVNIVVYDLMKQKPGNYRTLISDLTKTSTNVFFTATLRSLRLFLMHNYT